MRIGLLGMILFLCPFAFSENLQNGLDTGRYQIQSPSSKALPKAAHKDIAATASHQGKTHLRKPASASESDRRIDTSEEKSDTDGALDKSLKNKTTDMSQESEAKEKSPAEYSEPSLLIQWQSLWDNDAYRAIENYLAKIRPEDTRHERMSLMLKGSFVSMEAKSNYSYREFATGMPVVDLAAGMSVGPGIAVDIDYSQSFASDISGKPATHSREHFNYNHVGMSLNFKTYFSYWRKSPSVQYTVGYDEWNHAVNASSTERFTTKSSGLWVGLKINIPTSPIFAWNYFGQFAPRLTHSENGNSTNSSSGSHKESFRMEVGMGGEYSLGIGRSVVFDVRTSYL